MSVEGSTPSFKAIFLCDGPRELRAATRHSGNEFAQVNGCTQELNDGWQIAKLGNPCVALPSC
jgi:hypothetical protein